MSNILVYSFDLGFKLLTLFEVQNFLAVEVLGQFLVTFFALCLLCDCGVQRKVFEFDMLFELAYV